MQYRGVTKNGIIVKTVNLGIANYNICEFLKSIINVPISVKNDGKCACLAEYENLVKHELNGNVDKVLFLNIGTGIGGGIIYNGKLLEGSQFDGFEFGHMTIERNGIQCNCGKRGCFEKYGSILEYKNKVKNRLNIDVNVNGENLRKIMEERQREIEDIREEYIYNLCIGISNLINIFEPDTIIIGGGFCHFAYMFMEDIKKVLINSNLLFNRREWIDIRIAKLGNDAGIIGATL